MQVVNAARLGKTRVTCLCLVVAIAWGAAEAPGQQVPPCAPSTAAALRFLNLPTAIAYGPEQRFGFDLTSTGSEMAGNMRLTMTDSETGRRIFTGEARSVDVEAQDELFFLELDLGDAPVVVRAAYPERDEAGATCTRTIERRVRGYRRLYFPSRCVDERRRPSAIVVACGDGALVARHLRWRGWDTDTPSARGEALANDCLPSCVAGHYRRHRTRIGLSRPRRCRAAGGVYQYTRLTLTAADGKKIRVPFRCIGP
jgi:hypothetical protein